MSEFDVTRGGPFFEVPMCTVDETVAPVDDVTPLPTHDDAPSRPSLDDASASSPLATDAPRPPDPAPHPPSRGPIAELMTTWLGGGLAFVMNAGEKVATAAGTSTVLRAAVPVLARYGPLGLVFLPGDTPRDTKPDESVPPEVGVPVGPRAQPDAAVPLRPLPVGPPDINGVVPLPPFIADPKRAPRGMVSIAPDRAKRAADPREPTRAQADTDAHAPAALPAEPATPLPSRLSEPHRVVRRGMLWLEWGVIGGPFHDGYRVTRDMLAAGAGLNPITARRLLNAARDHGLLDDAWRVVPGARAWLLGDHAIAPLPDAWRRPATVSHDDRANTLAMRREIERVLALGLYPRGARLPDTRDLVAGLDLPDARAATSAYAWLEAAGAITFEPDGSRRSAFDPSGHPGPDRLRLMETSTRTAPHAGEAFAYVYRRLKGAWPGAPALRPGDALLRTELRSHVGLSIGEVDAFVDLALAAGLLVRETHGVRLADDVRERLAAGALPTPRPSDRQALDRRQARHVEEHAGGETLPAWRQVPRPPDRAPITPDVPALDARDRPTVRGALMWLEDGIVSGRLRERLTVVQVMHGARVAKNAAREAIAIAQDAGWLVGRGVAAGAVERLSRPVRELQPLPAVFKPLQGVLKGTHASDEVQREVMRVMSTGHYAFGASMPSTRELTQGLGQSTVWPVHIAYRRLIDAGVLSESADGEVRSAFRPSGDAAADQRRLEALAGDRLSTWSFFALLYRRLLDPASDERLRPGEDVWLEDISAVTGQSPRVVQRAVREAVEAGVLVEGEHSLHLSPDILQRLRAGRVPLPAAADFFMQDFRRARAFLVDGVRSGRLSDTRPLHLQSLAAEGGWSVDVLRAAIEDLRDVVALRYYEADDARHDTLATMTAPLVRRAGEDVAAAVVERVVDAVRAGTLRDGSPLRPMEMVRNWNVPLGEVLPAFETMLKAGIVTKTIGRYRVSTAAVPGAAPPDNLETRTREDIRTGKHLLGEPFHRDATGVRGDGRRAWTALMQALVRENVAEFRRGAGGGYFLVARPPGTPDEVLEVDRLLAEAKAANADPPAVDTMRDILRAGEVALRARFDWPTHGRPLGIGRREWRDALRVLAAEGLVSIDPDGGSKAIARPADTPRQVLDRDAAATRLHGRRADSPSQIATARLTDEIAHRRLRKRIDRETHAPELSPGAWHMVVTNLKAAGLVVTVPGHPSTGGGTFVVPRHARGQPGGAVPPVPPLQVIRRRTEARLRDGIRTGQIHGRLDYRQHGEPGLTEGAWRGILGTLKREGLATTLRGVRAGTYAVDVSGTASASASPRVDVKQATTEDRLRDVIRQGTVSLQERLVYLTTGKPFGVSLKTWSLACQALEAEGLVEIRRGAGTFVVGRPPGTPDSVREADRRRAEDDVP